ncbi:hypothetical protein GEV33_002034 [Tenebrio molitor]|uniref:Uncharacterized protein n=1 Tax=Tenebrio molitor TaxID=7067 RepID=A0A8J6HUA1_TENMO|nr:hypothetical protein GEV33_002034 [Tenebrio molitor]
MRQLRPAPANHHDNRKVFVQPALSDCSHVFLRDDSVRKPLQQPYTGPHRVMQRNQKTLTIQAGGREVTVSLDRRHQHFQRHQHQPQLVPPQGQDERNDSLRDFVTTSESLGGEYCGDINPFECPAKKKLRTDEDTRTRQESRR